jgi:hypothetical protein
MPWFSLHRNYTMSTTVGHAINFKKGETVWVPPICVPQAIAIGAIPSVPLGAELDVLPEETKVAPPALTLDQRQEKYFDAFGKIVQRSRRDDFLASGLPHIKKVEELAGLVVSAAERDEMWQKYVDRDKEEVA